MTKPNEIKEHDDQMPEVVSEQSQELREATHAAPQQLSPLEQMQQAKAMGLSVDEMQQMMALQKEYEANEARKAFHAALAEFKKNPPQVVKDKLNEKFGSAYTSIENMVNTVNQAMGPLGLNARWEFPEDGTEKIFVTCILAHALGHEEKVRLWGLPDTSGSKNPIQERKSTRTYLKLETFEAVTGMASAAGNLNDDGNAAGQSRAPQITVISEGQFMQIHAKLTENELDASIFSKWLSKKYPYTKGDYNQLSVDHFAMVMAKLDESIKAKASKTAAVDK